MIGGSNSDVAAGEAAGCNSIKFAEGGLLEAVKSIFQVMKAGK